MRVCGCFWQLPWWCQEMLLIILGVQATPWGSAFSQSFPGTYLFPGKQPPSCRAPGLREAPASCLHPGTGRSRGDPSLNPLIPLVWGKSGIEACPHWANSYLSFKALATKAPPLGAFSTPHLGTLATGPSLFVSPAA